MEVHERREGRRVLGDQCLVGDRYPDVGMRHDAGDLMGRQSRIHRHRDTSGPVDGRVAHEPSEGIGSIQMDRRTIARPEPGSDEAAGQAVGLAVPLREGQRAPVDHSIGALVGILLRHPTEELG